MYKYPTWYCKIVQNGEKKHKKKGKYASRTCYSDRQTHGSTTVDDGLIDGRANNLYTQPPTIFLENVYNDNGATPFTKYWHNGLQTKIYKHKRVIYYFLARYHERFFPAPTLPKIYKKKVLYIYLHNKLYIQLFVTFFCVHSWAYARFVYNASTMHVKSECYMMFWNHFTAYKV